MNNNNNNQYEQQQLHPTKDENETELEIDLEQLSPIVPPDGGWGWMIVLGSFICMILVDGMCFSYGIFLSALQETFSAGKMQMAFAGSLLTGCYFMIGPAVSGLLNRFGAREITFIGTAISSVAIFISTFMQDLTAFIVLFGVCGGIGYGLVYLPAATIVTSWFVKKRATVTGIVMAGSGLGGLVYSLVVPILINEYTWRGCIIILAAVNLNCAVAAALFRTLDSSAYPKQQIKDIDNEIISLTNLNNQDYNGKPMELGDSTIILDAKKKMDIRELARQYVDTKVVTSSNPKLDSTIKQNNSEEDLSKVTPIHVSHAERLPMLSMEAVNRAVDNVISRKTILSSTNLTVPDNVISRKAVLSTTNLTVPDYSIRHKLSVVTPKSSIRLQPTDSSLVFRKPDNFGSTSHFASGISLKLNPDQQYLNDANIRQAIVDELRKEISRPVHKKDLFLSGSLIHLNEYVSTTDVATYIRSVTAPAEETHMHRPIWSMIKSLLGLEMLKSPTFILLAISSVFSMIGYCVPYQFLKDNAQLRDVPEMQASHLLAYLGAFNTVGRIFTGWLSDRSWVNVVLINNGALLISGIITALVPLFKSHLMLVIYACAYGYFIAAFVSVRTILIVEVIGLDRLTNTFGLLLLFQAFALIFAPPGMGSLFDVLGNFDLIFILAGISIAFSGILCFPLSRVADWERQKLLATADAEAAYAEYDDDDDDYGEVEEEEEEENGDVEDNCDDDDNTDCQTNKKS